jgi:hypothetical protein
MTLLVLAGATVASAQSPSYRVLDPRGAWPAVERIPLAARVGNLAGKRVYVIKSWAGGSGFDQTVLDLAKALEAKGSIATIKDRNVAYSQDDPKLWAEMKERQVAGFIYVAAASSSTTSYAFKWSAKLEHEGIPGVVAAFRQLASVGETTNQREGAPVRSVFFSYPVTAMEPAVYQADLAAAVEALARPVTEGEKRTGKIEPVAAPKVLMEGDITAVQESFHELGLTDGLPIVPPTEELVAQMLKGTRHRADEVVAEQFYPEGLRVTVREVAINAVMAGCLPAHLPVLLAAVEAFQKNNLNSMLRSTNSFSFMQVVNGPIRKELGMNADVNTVGPGNRANAVMGRALRLFIVNLGGGKPGTNIMAVIGNNTGHGFMFAENEESSPWEPLNVTKGFAREANTLSLFSGGWSHSGNYNLGSEFVRVAHDIARFEFPQGATVIISPQRAEALKRDGMNKADAIDFLWRNAVLPLGELRKERFFREPKGLAGHPENEMVPVYPKGSIEIVVAGGDAAPMMQAWHFYRPVTVSIDKWR